MASNPLLAFVGGLGSGYLTQTQRNREMDRQDKQDAMREREFNSAQEVRDMQLAELKRNQKEAQGARDAAMPDAPVVEASVPFSAMQPGASEAQVEPELNTTVGKGAQAKSFAGPQGLKSANEYAQSINDPLEKTAKYWDGVNPEKAAQIRSVAGQAKLHGIQLKGAELDWADKQSNRVIADKMRTNGGDAFQTMADIITDTNLGGLSGSSAKVQVNPDGSRQIIKTSPDGSTTAGKVYPAGDQGHALALQDISNVDLPTRIQWLHEQDKARLAREDRDQNVKFKQQELDIHKTTADKQALVAERQLALMQRQTALAERRGAAGTAESPIWSKDEDDFLKKLYTEKDDSTGKTVYDGDGFQFAQNIAIAAARKNGGNTAAASGYAMDIDNNLKAKAKGDPVMLRQLRAQALGAMRQAPAK